MTRTWRVLVVDDSEDLRMLLRLKLETWGHYDVVGEGRRRPGRGGDGD